MNSLPMRMKYPPDKAIKRLLRCVPKKVDIIQVDTGGRGAK